MKHASKITKTNKYINIAVQDETQNSKFQTLY